MIRFLGPYGLLALTGLIAALICFTPLAILADCQQANVVAFFQDHLRQPLFAGLLTVSAFLFSLKTFILVTMNEKVYSTAKYEELWRESLKLDKTLKRYAPLERFATLLFLSVLISLIGAVTQFSIGFLDSTYAVAVALAAAIWSIEMIFVSLIFLRVNLRQWFKFLSDSSI